MDNEMIERCETAINKLQDTGEVIGVKQVVIEVIKAMREPTHNMKLNNAKYDQTSNELWQRMIDAIINE